MWIAGIDVHSCAGAARSSGRNVGGWYYSRESAKKINDLWRGSGRAS